jgi:hypothetical protein
MLPTLTAVVLLQISTATARPRYDLRALLGAVGLILLLLLALLAATIDALAASLVESAREATRVKVRFGPAPPPLAQRPPPIADDMLLDKRGRPLRGVARSARIAAIERERAALAATAVAAVPADRVIELPALPDLSRIHIPVPALSMRGIRIVAITTTMTFVFATAIGTTGFIAQRGSVALGASTTLTVISGDVAVQAAAGEQFTPAADGATLKAGMTIRTSADAYAVLTYFEGSTVSLDPSTTLVIEALYANPDGSTVIAMRQQLGRTWHSVTKLLHGASKYEVRTPSATAAVRGTAFAVAVQRDDKGEIESVVETTEGAVATSKAPTAEEPQPKEEVLVQPGFQVTVKPSVPLEQPKPAPEPERKVTVTVGATASVVLDPLGRANGIKDGKVVVQTPGATVREVQGRLVVTLPNIPDGKLATVVDPKVVAVRDVEVEAVVAEKGKPEQKTTQRIEATPVQAAGAQTAAAIVTAVELKKGAALQVSQVSEQQQKDIASTVRVAEAPKHPAVTETASDESKDKKDAQRDAPGGPPAPPAAGFVPDVTVPPLPLRETVIPAIAGAREAAKEQAKQEKDAKEASKAAPRPEGAAPGQEAPRQEAPRQEPAKVEAPSGFVPRIDLSLPGVPRVEAPKQEVKQEAPRAEAPKQEAPKQEAPKQEAPRVEAPRQEAPRQEVPRQEAPRQEPPKEEPKQEAPKQEARPETGGFAPKLELPSLPFGDSSRNDRQNEREKDKGR